MSRCWQRTRRWLAALAADCENLNERAVVVTKDVEPYSIVGGVPAKEIRKRFAPDIVWKLQNLQWWNWPVERIKEYIHDIQSGNIEAL